MSNCGCMHIIVVVRFCTFVYSTLRASPDVYSCTYVHSTYGQKDSALANKFLDRSTQPQTARWNVDMVCCGSATGLPAWRSTRGGRGRKRSRNDLGKVVNLRNSLLEDRSTGLYTHTFNPFQVPLMYVYTYVWSACVLQWPVNIWTST